jgi:O-antigen/teichoic acid export membrane protein
LLKNLNDHKKSVIFNYLSISSNIVTGFVLFPLIIKNMGLAPLGVFSLLFSARSIIGIGIDWLSSSITKNLIRYKLLQGNILAFSFIINIFYGAFSFFIIMMYGYFQKEEYLLSILYFAFFSFISFSVVPIYQYLKSELKQSHIALFYFLQQFLFMVLSISCFYIFNIKSLDKVFLTLLISSIILLIVAVIHFNRTCKIKLSLKKINMSLIKRLLFSDGAPFFLNAASTMILLQVDILLIDYLYGNASAGIYTIIWKIPNTLITLGWKLSDPFRAIVAKSIIQNKKMVIKQFFILEKTILLAAAIAAVAYYFLGNFFLKLWLGGENIPNLEYMYIISSLVIVFSIMQRFYTSINYFTKGLNFVTLIQFIEVASKILFIIYFFNTFKELAPIVGWCFVFIFSIFFYRKNSLKVLKI